MKEFSTLRTELKEGIEEHVNVPFSSMPPNILILKRKTVRQFPNQTMVALYYNDKLDQYFSIPYGGEADSIVNPVALAKEETHPFASGKTKEDDACTTCGDDKPSHQVSHQIGDKVRYRSGSEAHLRVGHVREVHATHLVVHRKGTCGQYGYHYRVPHDAVVHNSRTGYTREVLKEEKEELNERRPMSESLSVSDSSKTHGYKFTHNTPGGSYVYAHPDGHKVVETDDPNGHWTHYHAPTKHTGTSSTSSIQGFTGDSLHKHLTKFHGLSENVIQEDAISHSHRVKAFQTDKPLRHRDGSQTMIDPTTANALLTVHAALHPDNQKKFADSLEHSKPKFHKMLDFAWRQVK